MFVYIKTKHDKKTEHEQWLRGQQINAYAGLIDSAMEAMAWISSAYKIEDEYVRHKEALSIMGVLKSGYLVLVAPPATLVAADDMITSLHDFAREVDQHGYSTSSPQYSALREEYGSKQLLFNARCRIDFKAPDWKNIKLDSCHLPKHFTEYTRLPYARFATGWPRYQLRQE